MDINKANYGYPLFRWFMDITYSNYRYDLFVLVISINRAELMMSIIRINDIHNPNHLRLNDFSLSHVIEFKIA